MLSRITDVDLDVALQNRANPVPAKQYDYNSRYIRAHIFDNGQPVLVGKNGIVTINATRPDGEVRSIVAEIQDDGSVLAPVSYWMVELAGIVMLDMSLMNAENRKITTMSFVLDVEESNFHAEEPKPADPNHDIYVDVLISEQSRKEAENQRVKNEEARIEAEKNRQKQIQDNTDGIENLRGRVETLEKNPAGEIPKASSTVLGGIRVGTEFDISENGTLSLYHQIGIVSFANNHTQNPVGSTVNSVTLNWLCNKTPNTVSIKSGETIIPVEPASSTSKTLIDQNIKTNKSYTLTVTDARKSVSKTSSVLFYNYVSYGVGGSETYSVDSMTNVLSAKNIAEFSANATGDNSYIYYIVPATFAKPTFYVGGFEGGFIEMATNQIIGNGSKEGFMNTQYNVYRSKNPNLGNTKVVIE